MLGGRGSYVCGMSRMGRRCCVVFLLAFVSCFRAFDFPQIGWGGVAWLELPLRGLQGWLGGHWWDTCCQKRAHCSLLIGFREAIGLVYQMVAVGFGFHCK